jgi:multicomponent Na+:H+ antiporter subunit C
MISVGYILVTTIFVLGLSGAVYQRNLVKKLISLSVAQTGIIMLFIFGSYNPNHFSPFYKKDLVSYVDPIPQALMLTAIVVGFSTTAIGLAMAIRIKKSFGTIDYDEIESKMSSNIKK